MAQIFLWWCSLVPTPPMFDPGKRSTCNGTALCTVKKRGEGINGTFSPHSSVIFGFSWQIGFLSGYARRPSNRSINLLYKSSCPRNTVFNIYFPFSRKFNSCISTRAANMFVLSATLSVEMPVSSCKAFTIILDLP